MTETSNKLLDDCFLHDQRMLTHDEAIALLSARIRPIVSSVRVPLAAAAGRVLAATVTAPHPVPAHTNAAVDGYAFAHARYDAKAGARFPVAGRAAAGHPYEGRPPAGDAVRIFTGAVMPAGLDTVAMQEDCTVENAAEHAVVRIPGGLKARANVRAAGEDVAAGATLLEAGRLLRPQDLAALASVGLAEVACFEQLTIALVSTGDEVVRPGQGALLPGQVYDANSPMLGALAGLAGAAVEDLGIWPDRADEVERRLAAAARRFDVILTSGGASRGEEDHIAAAIARLGRRHFWQIAVKPGRPMMFGQIANARAGAVVVGLPGNPVAVLVCFLMYVHPMLRRLGGAPWPEPRRWKLPAVFAFPKRKLGRRELWRGMLVERDGTLAVDKFARDGSGLISSLRAADGLIDIPESVPEVRPGQAVDFIPFSEFGLVAR
jgi:molybdopterin molybdotransferase